MTKLSEWKKKYYPVGASTIARKKGVTDLELLDHSILKWEGLQQAALKNMGGHLAMGTTGIVFKGNPFTNEQTAIMPISSKNCALCQKYDPPRRGDSSCTKCPLAISRGGVQCFSRAGSEMRSPWNKFSSDNDPVPMLRALKKARAKLIAKQSEQEVQVIIPDTSCSKCGQPWDEHEFGVPAPFCPPAVKKPALDVHIVTAPTITVRLDVATGRGLHVMLNAVLHKEIERQPNCQYILVHTTADLVEQGAQTIKHPTIKHMSWQGAIKARQATARWPSNTTVVFVGCKLPKTLMDRIAYGATEIWVVGRNVSQS
jgi:hypothetical protein